MKIAMVTGSYPEMPCGVGDHAALLASALVRRGHRVRVITSRDSRVRTSADVFPVVESWGPGCDRTVAETAGDSEILHFHVPTQGYGRSLSARRIPVSRSIRVPVVSTVHEFSKLHWLHRWAMMPVLRGSRALIVPGEEECRFLKKRWDKATHIPVGPNILPSDSAVPRADDLVCFFGMVYPGKGLRSLLDVSRVLGNATLSIVGQVHPSYARMYDRLRDLAGEKVSWTGRLEASQVSQILSRCTLCILPYEEGASLRRTTLVSALAHGAPVVTTRPQTPIEGLEEAACLVDAADGAALEKSIRELMADPPRRERLSGAAVRFASQLNWETIAERTEEVYRQCLESGTSA